MVPVKSGNRPLEPPAPRSLEHDAVERDSQGTAAG